MASDCSVTARRPRAHSLVDQKSALETASDGQGAASKSRRAHGTRAVRQRPAAFVRARGRGSGNG